MPTKRFIYPVATLLRKVPALHIPLAVIGIAVIVACAFVLVLLDKDKVA